MRQYETAFLITPKLEEEETEKLIEKMAEVVKKKKGKMVNIEKWGKRKLAYPIDKLDEAIYVFFHYEGSPDIPHELQRRFRQTETVLRYLTLKKDEQTQLRKKAKPGKRGKAKKAEEKGKIAEEPILEPEKKEESKKEPPEELPEVPPEVTEPEPEILAEEKE
ncbi:MAG: 30S ribosomal protein S6 [Candidatus Aminicenantes bacterium]|nr:MAG: 30S ribosomal protein S6 [Candidatus Aminicenantes bacterium]